MTPGASVVVAQAFKLPAPADEAVPGTIERALASGSVRVVLLLAGSGGALVLSQLLLLASSAWGARSLVQAARDITGLDLTRLLNEWNRQARRGIGRQAGRRPSC